MNSNLITGYIGGTSRNQIKSLTLASTVETEFKVITDDATNAIAVLTMPGQSQILGSQTPSDLSVNPALLNSGFNRTSYFGDSNPPYNSGVFDSARPFLLRICGVATPASNAGNSLTIKLYLGTTKSGTNIATTGAVPLATTVTPTDFIVEAQLKWSVLSTTVRGQFWFDMAGTSGTQYVTWAGLTSSAGTAAAVANLQFCSSCAWGNAAGGVVAVSEMSLTQL